MGVCFECLVVIDGKPDQQSCMVVVREGMTVQSQQGATDVTDVMDVTAGEVAT
jgi:predicted molibdopterin-dependent oxidoreductase YjgC